MEAGRPPGSVCPQGNVPRAQMHLRCIVAKRAPTDAKSIFLLASIERHSCKRIIIRYFQENEIILYPNTDKEQKKKVNRKTGPLVMINVLKFNLSELSLCSHRLAPGSSLTGGGPARRPPDL